MRRTSSLLFGLGTSWSSAKAAVRTTRFPPREVVREAVLDLRFGTTTRSHKHFSESQDSRFTLSHSHFNPRVIRGLRETVNSEGLACPDNAYHGTRWCRCVSFQVDSIRYQVHGYGFMQRERAKATYSIAVSACYLPSSGKAQPQKPTRVKPVAARPMRVLVPIDEVRALPYWARSADDRRVGWATTEHQDENYTRYSQSAHPQRVYGTEPSKRSSVSQQDQ
jgi:hypothetical protein